MLQEAEARPALPGAAAGPRLRQTNHQHGLCHSSPMEEKQEVKDGGEMTDIFISSYSVLPAVASRDAFI